MSEKTETAGDVAYRIVSAYPRKAELRDVDFNLAADIVQAIDAAVARERSRAAVFENAYRELMDKHEQVSRELEARQVEVATAEAAVQHWQDYFGCDVPEDVGADKAHAFGKAQARANAAESSLVAAEAKWREAEREEIAQELVLAVEAAKLSDWARDWWTQVGQQLAAAIRTRTAQPE